MQDDLRDFLYRFVGTVALTLVPVVFIAFASMPMALSRHPGEAPSGATPLYVHMT